MAIGKEIMFEQALVVCPSFRPIYQEFLTDWEDDEETERNGLPYYLALGDLAHHLVELLKAKNTQTFPEVFELVELWHIDGDDYVKEAASIGLLEGIQNIALSDKHIVPSDFIQWLGPVSRKWWNKLNQFWDGNYSALQSD